MIMTAYYFFKNEISQISQNLSSSLSKAKSIPGMADCSFGDWEKTCSEIPGQISEAIIRLAVVGPIKSGKSTCVNALLKGDYLKRGAGVVTSIVTRIRRGPALQAVLYFKSWDEVNADVQQAMVLFPSWSQGPEDTGFDIRRKKDRENLRDAIDSLNTDLLFNNGTRNVNGILLASYLKGYEGVKDIVSADRVTRCFKNNLFEEHKNFVGDGNLSVYLKDVQLEIADGGLDDNLEIADCQGSDSPNPLHLAMIQDYLLKTHFIIYVISSRTGLRQADMKFLSVIKKMGILQYIIFIVNFDFNEHDGIEDLDYFIKKLKEELSLLKPDPKIFTFSALFNLFRAQRNHLPPKDSLRLAQWENEKELSEFSNRETDRFESFLNHTLTNQRNSLLFKNHIERLTLIASGINHWARINQNILAQDASRANEITEELKKHQKRMDHIKSLIKSTLNGAVQKIKNEIKSDVDRFFDFHSGHVLTRIIEFIRSYNFSHEQYRESFNGAGFHNTLHLIFMEFKHSLDRFVAEFANPEIIQFVKKKENHIREYLESVVIPYDVMVRETLAEYYRSIESLGIKVMRDRPPALTSSNMESIKSILGLALPSMVVSMQYAAKIKTEAVMRLGFYTITKLFKKFLGKPVLIRNEETILALEAGMKRMKRETEASVFYHFKNYKENIKFQYIFKLIDAVSNSLFEALFDRFQAYITDLSKASEFLSNKRIDKQRASEMFEEMKMTTADIHARIVEMKEKLNVPCSGAAPGTPSICDECKPS
jgi:GTPase SAR1 family protein